MTTTQHPTSWNITIVNLWNEGEEHLQYTGSIVGAVRYTRKHMKQHPELYDMECTNYIVHYNIGKYTYRIDDIDMVFDNTWNTLELCPVTIVE